MEWYTPLTILPAVALIILSTSNFIINLNNEIFQLQINPYEIQWVIDKKMDQLKKLGLAIVMLYISTLFFILSSLVKVTFDFITSFKYLMVMGVILMTISLIFLCIHSIKAINIRKHHLKMMKEIIHNQKSKL